ncbi:tripartite tricarboxylate transporter TctB family protein [Nitratireductor mangrovi]|uniref:Tripartite tricarboxylate transporter TctB family protein n=1 Tax=Nitratireductor mangrovi TaxID=2599600 RepID=A0A5B8KVI7_9HYPH|nr:tripartite tricarboxylate transporter TctB family protein [Nitratireductor mangrovi]QDY99587.1 tripartite tricarboxylate transporter TctB family protein [Nitratireductor mangrovi]
MSRTEATGKPAPRYKAGQAAGGDGDRRPEFTELLAGVAFAGIALVGMTSLANNEYLELGRSGSDPGPGFVPWIALTVLLVGGIVHMLSVLRRAVVAGGFGVANGEFSLARLWVPALMLASLVVYQAALRPFGFLAASITFGVVWVAVLHWRSANGVRSRHVFQLPAEGAALAVGVYLIFRHGIQVPLP